MITLEKMVLLDEEVSTMQDIAVDGIERHENSILANVPKALSEKGVLAVTLFMYFMDQDTISEWTGKPTFMNVEESYIMSGIYPDSHLKNVYKITQVAVDFREHGKEWTEMVDKMEVINRKEDMRIRAEAKRYWNQNGLESFFDQVAIEKFGGIDPEKLLRYSIITDAVRNGDNQTVNRKMAIDILGMKVKNKVDDINLKTRGGGEIIETTAKREGAGFLKSVADSDIDEEDDEWEPK